MKGVIITCTRPLIRAETFESYINKKGGLSYKVEWLQRDFYDDCMKTEKGRKYLKMKWRRVEPVPCGSCKECLLNYSREWAKDCMLEKQYYPESECWFITLTYNDENLPFNTWVNKETGEFTRGASLRKQDLQNFWKRARKKYPEQRIVYLNVGEYGSETQRPHYHAIVFGLPLDITKFKKIGINENGDALWTSPELQQLWSLRKNGKYYPIGNVQIGRVTYKSVAYTCRYALKKAKGQDKTWQMLNGRQPEFISMSQGIGYKYYRDYAKQMIETDMVPTPIGLKPIPRRFLRILKEQEPELYEAVKRKRKQDARTAQLNNNTDLNPEEQRKQKEAIYEAAFKDMRSL